MSLRILRQRIRLEQDNNTRRDMKLIDSNKRFQFIKNQQVEIDKDLEKYQRLLVIKEVGSEKYEAIVKAAEDMATQDEPRHPDEDQSGSTMVSTVQLSNVMDLMQDHGMDPQEAIIQNVRKFIPDVDAKLREIIHEMSENGIREYLNSPDAAAFNKRFMPVLLGEVAHNGYSVGVVNGRWDYEDSLTYGNIVLEEGGGSKKKGSLISRIKKYFKTKKDKPTYDYTILQLFDLIHVESDKSRDFIDRISGYFELLRNAGVMHQKAQMDKICQRLVIDIYESVLATHGFNKYITFGNIEKLQQKCEKVIDIDYIKNFGRTIPSDVIKKKEFCDSLCVFDNYCVLYYDPTGATYQSTAKERRDPVLFGLINHSDRLYYIDSWIDEKCDLTLDQIAEKLGKKSIGDLDKDQKEVDKKAGKILAKEAKR